MAGQYVERGEFADGPRSRLRGRRDIAVLRVVVARVAVRRAVVVAAELVVGSYADPTADSSVILFRSKLRYLMA